MGAFCQKSYLFPFFPWNLTVNKIVFQLFPSSLSINCKVISRKAESYFKAVFYFIIIKPFRICFFRNLLFFIGKNPEFQRSRFFFFFTSFSYGKTSIGLPGSKAIGKGCRSSRSSPEEFFQRFHMDSGNIL